MVKFAKETRAKNVDWEVDLGCGSSAGTKYDDLTVALICKLLLVSVSVDCRGK